ncbi:MAG: hypothetical protein F2723_04040 [Actinobacteria bacterium]|nr:hypothetical protein [Actinomycetota bacterium]
MLKSLRQRSTLSMLAASVIATCAIGASALPSGAAPPTVANPYPQAGMEDKGACFGLSIGAARDSTGSAGLTLTNRAMSIAVKGVATTTAQAAAGEVGGCLFDDALGVHSNAPVVKKFSAKITSSSADCKLEDNDPTERPWIGKVMWSLDSTGDGTVDAKVMGYLRITGVDSDVNEFIWVTGIVTKGDAVGSTISGSLLFAPIFKSRVATSYYSDVPQQTWDVSTPLGTDTAQAVAPGYGFSILNGYYYGNCGRWGEILGQPNVRDLAFGAGLISPLGNTSTGFHFLI